jgi:hypothetical protein
LERGVGSLGDKSLYESFFVCITQSQNDLVQILYGKTNGNKDEGQAKSAFTFPDSEGERLTFYSFGTGHQLLKIDDVSIESTYPVLKCPTNYTKKDGSCKLVCDKECKLCHKAKDATACLGCKHLKDTVENGVEKCVKECPDGKTGLKNHEICEECKKGEYGQEGNCYKCRAGSYQDEEGQTVCKPCTEGSYSKAKGSTSCTKCKIGYHQNLSGQTSCNKCPGEALFKGNGAVNCNNECKPGTYWNIAANTILPTGKASKFTTATTMPSRIKLPTTTTRASITGKFKQNLIFSIVHAAL